MDRVRSVLTAKWMFLVYGLLVGVLVILGIRFVTYQPPSETHYHANFAVYINGTREQFAGSNYYEEVQLCDLHGSTPESRAHMHDHNNGVVHVHDQAVTWGQFFENLGWYVGPDFIRTPSQMYMASDTDKLNVILNGQNITGLQTITNEVIQDKDRLLISYGNIDDATLQAEYKSVPSDAAKVDAEKDPASCGGAENASTSERLKHLF